MKLSELKQYLKNFEYFQKLLEDGHEITVIPVKLEDGSERAAMCTKKGDEIFPHAILAWANPHEIFKPTLVEEDTKEYPY